MIISASYKTDIPTFYGEWFVRRLRAGFCMMINPYNRKAIRVALDRASVTGFVFWTKNVHPFLGHLPEVRDRGFPFVVQHTINRYPRALETSVADVERMIQAAWSVRDQFGPQALVWRYDTILDSSLTPVEFHVENFRWLASRLKGATNEVVISFAQIYKKTERNLTEAGRELGFQWRDPGADEKRQLARRLVEIARESGLQLTICSQRDLLVEGAGDAKCVDVHRMERVAGATFQARLKGNRKECGCFESRDIGEYDTCPHGCRYCYAVQSREVALRRYQDHDPDSDFLFAPTASSSVAPVAIDDAPQKKSGAVQLRLIKD